MAISFNAETYIKKTYPNKKLIFFALLAMVALTADGKQHTVRLLKQSDIFVK